MKMVAQIVKKVLLVRIPRIRRFMNDPAGSQQKIFRELVAYAKNTEWGKTHGYCEIQTVTEFQSRVPVSSYEEIFPWIERMMQGERNILWPGRISWFSKSSGTTNARSKFIPVSKESLHACHFRGGKDMLALYVHNVPGTQIFSGKVVGITGSLQDVGSNTSIQSGDISAVITKNLPRWAEMLRTPRVDVALMQRWEEKMDRIIEETSDENVTSIAGVPTWEMVLLERMMESHKVQSIFDIWPNFELVMHGGVSFKPYRPLFEKIIGTASDNKQVHYMELYNASEGFFAIQDDLSRDDMLLMLDYGIFYEFIPMSEFGTPNARALTIGEVETNVNYAVVISTNGGLWRYIIGDTVRFTTLTPHRIKVTGRTKHFINTFGEELVVENAEDAITVACQKTNASVRKFTVAPLYMSTSSSGAHEWFVEFETEPASIDEFTDVLDNRLREINSDYDAKRGGDVILGRPVVHVLRAGVFYEWMASRGKLGGQNKVPVLSNTREYADEIISFIGKQ